MHSTIQTQHSNSNATNFYLGTDSVEKHFPDPAVLPSNLSLVVQRIDDPWPSAETNPAFSLFDYVHQRFVLPACEKIPKAQAVKNLAALLAPGGYIELVENDHNRPAMESGGFAKGEDMFRQMFMATGGDHEYPKLMKGWLEEAGLVDVTEEIVQVPIGRKNGNPEMAFKSTWSICSALRGLLPIVRGEWPRGYTSLSLKFLDIPNFLSGHS